jgi:hypothetical protein
VGPGVAGRHDQQKSAGGVGRVGRVGRVGGSRGSNTGRKFRGVHGSNELKNRKQKEVQKKDGKGRKVKKKDLSAKEGETKKKKKKVRYKIGYLYSLVRDKTKEK